MKIPVLFLGNKCFLTHHAEVWDKRHLAEIGVQYDRVGVRLALPVCLISHVHKVRVSIRVTGFGSGQHGQGKNGQGNMVRVTGSQGRRVRDRDIALLSYESTASTVLIGDHS